MLEKILNEIYPVRCLVCNKQSSCEYLCSSCKKEIKNLESKSHFFISEFGDTIYYYGKYRAGIGILVKKLKYSRKIPAGKIIGELLSYVIIEKFNPKPSLIIPVPISLRKLLKRRVNQCEIIGREISAITGIELNTNILKRKFELFEKDQVKLDKADRKQNLENSFYIAGKTLPASSIILLDDVSTTGRTINICKSLLLNSFPDIKVIPLVFAH